MKVRPLPVPLRRAALWELGKPTLIIAANQHVHGALLYGISSCSWGRALYSCSSLAVAGLHQCTEAACCNADSAQVAIFDATNSTEQRRQLLVSTHQQMKQSPDVGSLRL